MSELHEEYCMKGRPRSLEVCHCKMAIDVKEYESLKAQVQKLRDALEELGIDFFALVEKVENGVMSEDGVDGSVLDWALERSKYHLQSKALNETEGAK